MKSVVDFACSTYKVAYHSVYIGNHSVYISAYVSCNFDKGIHEWCSNVHYMLIPLVSIKGNYMFPFEAMAGLFLPSHLLIDSLLLPYTNIFKASRIVSPFNLIV